MYTQEDMRLADACVRKYALLLGFGLALLLAAYIAAIIMGSQALMLGVMLLAFWFASLEICLWLRPAMRYRSFLMELQQGLRRECLCTLEDMETDIQMQDGVRVYALQVRLQDGDTRIFYVNASKTADFPGSGSAVRLVSYGRHIIQWEAEKQ